MADFTDRQLLNIAHNGETTDADLQALGPQQLSRLKVLTAEKPPTFWDTHPNVKALAQGTVNTLPAIGGIAGGILTAEGGPITAGAGAAVGVGAGRGLRDLIAEHVGLEPESTPLGKSSRIALDTAIAGATPYVLNAVKNIITAPKESFADMLELLAHPSKTTGNVAAMMRSQGPKPILSKVNVSEFPQGEPSVPGLDRYAPNIGSGSSAVADTAATVRGPAQATYTQLADGSWGMKGSGLKAGESVHVMNRAGNGSMQIVGNVMEDGTATIAGSQPSLAKVALSSSDVLKVQGLMKQGVPEKMAVDAVLKLRKP